MATPIMNIAFSDEDFEKIKKLINDYITFQKTESEAKACKESTGTELKEILDKYGFNGKQFINNNTIYYNEEKSRIADSAKMKKENIFDKYSKETTKKPLKIS